MDHADGYDVRKTEAGDPDNELKIPIYGPGGIVGYESRNDQLRRNGGNPGLQDPHGYNPFTDVGMNRTYNERPHLRPQTQPTQGTALGFKHPGNTQGYRASLQKPAMRTVDDNARLVEQAKKRNYGLQQNFLT